MKEGLKRDLAAFLQVTGSPYQAVGTGTNTQCNNEGAECHDLSWSGMFVQCNTWASKAD